MKRVMALIGKLDRGMYWVTALCALAESLDSFGMLLISSVLLNQLTERPSLQDATLLMAVLVIGYGVLNYVKSALQQYRSSRIERISLLYRQMITEQVLHVPYQQLERLDFTELMGIIRNNDQNYVLLPLIIEDVYSCMKSAFSIVVAGFSFIQLFGVVQYLGDSAFLVSSLILIVFVLIIGSTGYIIRRRKQDAIVMQEMDRSMARLDARGLSLSAVMTEYSLGKHLRMYRMQPRILQEWETFEANMKDWYQHVLHLERGTQLLADISATIISGMIYLTVGVIALAGGLGAGSIIWYAGIVQRMLENVRSLIFKISNLNNLCIRQQPIFELMDIASEENESPSSEAYQTVLSRPSHVIEFVDVSFAYPDTDRMVLEHVNLLLSGQERIALVGRNGCGKSTLIKLICRLYDPTDGCILLDGIDIRSFPKQEYTKLLSVVFQDFQIFADTLAGNIAMSNKADCFKAKNIVHRVGLGFDDLQQPLLRDLDENGREISGGEGQKIAIARALYKDAPIVILDEPTAALDPLSESEIYEKFNLLVDGKLALFISHRLSSCRFCDRILVLQDGNIVQDGSHDELVKAKGLYQQMWNAQKQYYVQQ